jgi:hypothetical protein
METCIRIKPNFTFSAYRHVILIPDVYLGQFDFPVCNLVLNIAGYKQAFLNAFLPFIYQNLLKKFSLTLIQALNQKNSPKQAPPDGGGRVLFTIEIRMLKAQLQHLE